MFRLCTELKSRTPAPPINAKWSLSKESKISWKWKESRAETVWDCLYFAGVCVLSPVLPPRGSAIRKGCMFSHCCRKKREIVKLQGAWRTESLKLLLLSNRWLRHSSSPWFRIQFLIFKWTIKSTLKHFLILVTKRGQLEDFSLHSQKDLNSGCLTVLLFLSVFFNNPQPKYINLIAYPRYVQGITSLHLTGYQESLRYTTKIKSLSEDKTEKNNKI